MSLIEGKVLAIGEQPIDVHLTNSGPNLAEILGPAAIVLAALVGAWFAARYARQNVKQELAAAEARLKLQLDHDRQVRNRAAARSTIDDIVKTIEQIIDKDADFVVGIGHAEDLRRAVGELPEDSFERNDTEGKLQDLAAGGLERTRSEASEALMKAHPAKLRLRLRFAVDHPIVRTFSQWQSVMDQIYESSLKGLSANREPSEIEAAEELSNRVDPMLESFANAVQEWMDTVPMESEVRSTAREDT
jgi:hypothetical protein